jgi:hypothetical protein
MMMIIIIIIIIKLFRYHYAGAKGERVIPPTHS